VTKTLVDAELKVMAGCWPLASSAGRKCPPSARASDQGAGRRFHDRRNRPTEIATWDESGPAGARGDVPSQTMLIPAHGGSNPPVPANLTNCFGSFFTSRDAARKRRGSKSADFTRLGRRVGHDSVVSLFVPQVPWIKVWKGAPGHIIHNLFQRGDPVCLKRRQISISR
jgi:hypothetical protein